MSDSDGFIYDPAGIDQKKLDFILELKNVKRGSIREYADKFKCDLRPKARPGASKWT